MGSDLTRTDLQHTIALILYGDLACAPIDSMVLHNVLDFATGTGMWAIDFADKYPAASVIGTDLSPIQPD
jgi:methylase of polypeptide subunit release factors